MEVVFKNVNVVKNKGTAFQKTILNDFNFDLKSGYINGVCGNNGKSTVGKLICALEDISSGEIHVGDFIIRRGSNVKGINELRFQVGYLFSNPYEYLYNKTVREEIEFGLKLYKYKLDRIDTRASDSLKMVGLDDSYLNRNPRDLSLVEAKRVMLASVLAFNPEILIFDEFEKGLNKQDRMQIKKLLILLKKKFYKTIVVITNDITFMFDLCDFIYVIQDGRLVLEGDKTLIFNMDLYKYIRMPGIIKFSECAKEKGQRLGNYTDIKDLLKAVYRDAK